jgi:transcriptional regulator with XRE-family HTH domain
MSDSPSKQIHQGRNVKRFREILGIKQEALAYELGDEWNQKKISLLEQKEENEVSLLTQIAEVLKLPVEAFQNFDEEQAVNIIASTFHHTQGIVNYNSTFQNNPVDKIMQLHEEKIALYERMLNEKDVMMARLERLIGGQLLFTVIY